MINFKMLLVKIGLFLALSNVAAAADIETDDMAVVEGLAEKYRSEFGSERVLVAFDIDNTLLAMDKNIGSDQWYEWQSEMLSAGETEHLVADSIPGILEVLAKIYALSPTHQTQKDVSAIVNRIQDAGHPVIGLTARGSISRDATQRELKKAGIWFRTSGVGPSAGFVGDYLPYDLADLARVGITVEEGQRWGLKTPREVSYVNGLMMVSGQHKGAMLRTLLNDSQSDFDVIIFVDDKEKNTANVEQGFAGRSSKVVSVRYTREDDNVRQFVEGDKQDVIEQWRQLSDALQIFY